jgi:hypothetical protein
MDRGGTKERKYRKGNDLLIEHEEEREKGVVDESKQKEKIRGEKKREMQSINTKRREATVISCPPELNQNETKAQCKETPFP